LNQTGDYSLKIQNEIEKTIKKELTNERDEAQRFYFSSR